MRFPLGDSFFTPYCLRLKIFTDVLESGAFPGLIRCYRVFHEWTQENKCEHQEDKQAEKFEILPEFDKGIHLEFFSNKI